MKRRRRANTYTIQRKKTTQTRHRPAPGSSGRFGTVVKFFIIIAAIALLTYAGYKYALPVLQEKLPSLQISKKAASITPAVKETQKPLPVEETKPVPPPVQTEPKETFVKATQVEILNGCGQQGVAKILADKLKKWNYDVVNTGNYLKHGKRYFKVKKTKMIDQLNTPESQKKCLKLAKAIGLSPKQVQSFSNPNPIADITIIIGLDYQKLPIFKGKK